MLFGQFSDGRVRYRNVGSVREELVCQWQECLDLPWMYVPPIAFWPQCAHVDGILLRRHCRMVLYVGSVNWTDQTDSELKSSNVGKTLRQVPRTGLVDSASYLLQ